MPSPTDLRARVLTAVDAETGALVDALDALLRIPSEGGTAAEIDAQQHLAARWREEGLDVDTWELDLPALQADPDYPGEEVRRSAALGVTARLAGTGDGPTLLLDGHTDVVPPGDLDAWSGDPYVPRRTRVDGAEAVVARGAADMKAGLVAAWFAVRALRTAGARLRGDVVLAPVVGEEDGGLGTFALLRRGVRADYCVVPEPTGLDLVPANGGALTFRLTVRGLATHASRRTEGVSALEKLWPVHRALQDLEAARNADVDPLMRRWPLAYPLSLGTVQAGDWASTVPDRLVAEGRLGVALDEPVDAAKAALEAAVAAACAADPWLAEHPVEVTWWGGQYAPGRTDPEHPLLTAVAAAHAAAGGGPQETYGGPYGSDLRQLVGIGGIPTVQYGPGDSKSAHAPDEAVRLDEVLTCTRTLALLALDLCG